MGLRTPITGIIFCCARTAGGQLAQLAAPPSRVRTPPPHIAPVNQNRAKGQHIGHKIARQSVRAERCRQSGCIRELGLRVGPCGPANGRKRRVSPVAPRPRDGPLTEPTADAQPWRRERVLMPLSRHLTSAQRERVAAIRSSIRCPSFDNAESGLTTYERHVEGHYRLGEALEGECTNLFGCDASL